MNLKTKIGLIGLLLTSSFGGYLFNTNVKATTDGWFRFSAPNNGNLVQGCTYSADIRINTGSNNSSSADIIINYDPAKIEILDSNPNVADKQIKPGVAYQSYFGNKVNESTGEIRLTGASFDAPINGEDIFASISFKSKPAVTSASFIIKFDGAGATTSTDSNISIAESSLDALGSVQNGIFTFSSGSCVADTAAPNVTFINPTNGQLNVPSNQVVSLGITDNLSGVNLSTLEILVNGQLYTANSQEIQISGTSTNYSITLNQTDDIDPTTPSTILVKVRDFSNNLRQSFITFNNPSPATPTPAPTSAPTANPTSGPTTAATPLPTNPPIYITVIPTTTATPTPAPSDKIPPTIEFVNPVSRETISDNEELIIRLGDVGSGINPNTLQVLINDKKYTINDSTVRLEGNGGEYTVRIRDSSIFSKVTSSYLSVIVSDFGGNTSVSNIVFNIPKAVEVEEIVNKDPKVCNITDPETKPLAPVQNAPLTDAVVNLQQSVEDKTPQILKPFVKEAGVFGVATLVAALPFMIWIGSGIASFISGGLFFPLIFGLFASKNRLFGRIVKEGGKGGITLATIHVFDITNSKTLKNAVTTFKGRFTLRLPAGLYRLDISKPGYIDKSIDLRLEEEGYIVDVIELKAVEVLESNSIAENIQFGVFQIDPKIITIYFGLLLSFINVVYVRSLLSMVILGLMIMAGIYVTIKFNKRNKALDMVS
jgi:hypothetical protein